MGCFDISTLQNKKIRIFIWLLINKYVQIIGRVIYFVTFEK